jgi:hypothetical protein
MDQFTIKKEFNAGEKKFHEYLDFNGDSKTLMERINRIFDYLGTNNAEVLAFMLGQSVPLLETFRPGIMKDLSKEKSSDELKTMMKILLVLLDSMAYIGYIDVNYLPEEMQDHKSDKPFSMDFPKAMIDKVNEDNKKKKKNDKK